jgi:hypothetical protein
MSRAMVLLGILGAALWPAAAPAEFLLWKDGRGEVHITNQPKEIPSAYRGGATTLDPTLDQPGTKNPTTLWIHQTRSLDGITWISEWQAEGTRASEYDCERDRRNRIVAFAMRAQGGTTQPYGADMGGDRLSQIRFYCFVAPFDPR